ncbi:MAG: Hsp20/alpha crystallin family protein [Candidatus Omnitrophota bacterium]
MKNKTLMIVLAALGALLLFEAGYLLGMGQQRQLYRMLRGKYRHFQPRYTPFVGNMPREMTGMQKIGCASRPESVKKVIRQKSKSFFVAAMTSRETGTATVITINLPGLRKEDIRVKVRDGYLTVQAQQSRQSSVDKNGFYAEESSAAAFSQSIALPQNAKVKQISAEFKKETLSITVPKGKKAGKFSGETINIPVR